MLFTLQEIIESDKYVLDYPTLTKIQALRDRYLEYDESMRYKYAKALGDTFSTVDAAIFSFLNIANQLPRITPETITKRKTHPVFYLDTKNVERTIELFKKARDSMWSNISRDNLKY
jgi:hypothetical protein